MIRNDKKKRKTISLDGCIIEQFSMMRTEQLILAINDN